MLVYISQPMLRLNWRLTAKVSYAKTCPYETAQNFANDLCTSGYIAHCPGLPYQSNGVVKPDVMLSSNFRNSERHSELQKA
eukprot:g81920.t1